MSNVIEVYPIAGKTAYIAPAWQYDYGQTLHLNGIALPASYKAEFSNTTRGNAIPTVQTTDTVVIPAQFLESGESVYIWLVMVDAESRTTEYSIIVPIAARAKPTDEEPAPEEQSEIDQALAALNGGVDRVERIAGAIPDTIADALTEAKESGEFDGPQGPQGIQGETGPRGEPGPKGETGTPGQAGQDGVSPVITVANIPGGHRVIIVDSEHPTGQTFDVMDGDAADSPVQDVKVNGSSVLSNGVANIPMASPDMPGVVTAGAVIISGTTPSINALPDVQYVCGEVGTLDITLPANGCFDVVFESGATPTALTITPQTGMAMEWINGFVPTALSANTLYEINIKIIGNRCLGVAVPWVWQT